MSKETSAWDQLSTDSAQLLLCDLQPEIVARSKTIDRDMLSKSAGVLLKIARLFSLPTTLSVVPEGDKAPELISELRGSGFAQEKLRAWASPFFDEATKNLLAQSGRKDLIIGGFATEAVVLHAALDARAQAYPTMCWSQWTSVAGCPSEPSRLLLDRLKRSLPRSVVKSGASLVAIDTTEVVIAPASVRRITTFQTSSSFSRSTRRTGWR